jgi:hypothetical protein
VPREATAATAGLAAYERVDGDLPRHAAFANDGRAPAECVNGGDDPRAVEPADEISRRRPCRPALRSDHVVTAAFVASGFCLASTVSAKPRPASVDPSTETRCAGRRSHRRPFQVAGLSRWRAPTRSAPWTPTLMLPPSPNGL